MNVVRFILAKAAQGSRFRPREGALCPLCGRRAKVVGSPRWEGTLKVRYHNCTNPDCPLCRLKLGFKSVQEERPDA